MLDRFDRARYFVYITSNTDRIHYAVFLFADVFLKIRSADVRHNGNLHRCFIFPHDRAKVVLVAKFIFAEFLRIEQRLRSFIAHFHIIDAGGDVCTVKRFGKIVGKPKIVTQSAVPQRSVQYFDIGTER